MKFKKLILTNICTKPYLLLMSRTCFNFFAQTAFILLVSLFSCNRNKNVVEIPVEPIIQVQEMPKKDTIKTVRKYELKEPEINPYFDSISAVIDTFFYNSIEINVIPISKSYYDSIAKTSNLIRSRSSSGHTEKKSDSLVYLVNDSTYAISLQNGQIDTLADFIDWGAKEVIGFRLYNYLGYIDYLNSYLFYGSYYEASNSFLISRKNGRRINLLHHIVIDTSLKVLITYNWDGWGFTSGDFKIYTFSNDSLASYFSYWTDLNFEFNFTNFYWSMDNVYILSRNEFVIRNQVLIQRPIDKHFFGYSILKLNL